jgi:hypothetical protein
VVCYKESFFFAILYIGDHSGYRAFWIFKNGGGIKNPKGPILRTFPYLKWSKFLFITTAMEDCKSGRSYIQKSSPICKAPPAFFLCIFSSPTWRSLFSASGIFCGGGYQPGARVESSDQRKVPASQSLFLKSQKNHSSVLRRTRTWGDFRLVPSVYQPEGALLWLLTWFPLSFILGQRPFCDFRPLPSA